MFRTFAYLVLDVLCIYLLNYRRNWDRDLVKQSSWDILWESKLGAVVTQ